jgi:hypothetical protein
MMSRYEVILSVVVEADSDWEAYYRAVNGEHEEGQTLVEENGIRRLPDPIEYTLTDKGRQATKENA